MAAIGTRRLRDSARLELPTHAAAPPRDLGRAPPATLLMSSDWAAQGTFAEKPGRAGGALAGRGAGSTAALAATEATVATEGRNSPVCASALVSGALMRMSWPLLAVEPEKLRLLGSRTSTAAAAQRLKAPRPRRREREGLPGAILATAALGPVAHALASGACGLVTPCT